MTDADDRSRGQPPVSGHGLGLTFVLTALLSMQVGNSFAKRLTEVMTTPIGAVWVRMAFSGVILLLVALVRRIVTRHRVASATAVTPVSQQPRKAWIFAIAYGASLIAMNSMFYEAIARIPVGIVVTIEFLGPLAVAILGSRRALDFVWVGLAALGVVVLGVTPTPLTLVGVLLAAGAGTMWACYILLGARVARHWQGTGVLTGTCIGGAIVLAPFMLMGGNLAAFSWGTTGLGLAVALACTVLPYSLELLALGRLPTGLFAILESLAPAVSALAAWVLLGESLHFGDWIAIGCVVAASLGATTSQARLRR